MRFLSPDSIRRGLIALFSVAMAALRLLAADGLWVKIGVSESGVYEFTHQRLRELGFENPGKVCVRGFPAINLCDHDFESTPAGLPVMPSVHSGQKLVFYAEGPVRAWLDFDANFPLKRVRNPYASVGCYFLTDEPSNSSLPEVELPTLGDRVVDTHVSLAFFEDETELPADGGTWFVGKLFGRDGVSEAFAVGLPDAADSKLDLYVSSAICNLNSGLNNYLKPEFPDGDAAAQNLKFVSAPRCGSEYESFRTSTTRAEVLRTAPGDSLRIRFVRSREVDLAAVDYFGIAYSRRNTLPLCGWLEMFLKDVKAGEGVAFRGADTEEPAVWRLADDGSAALLPVLDGIAVMPEDAPSARLLALDLNHDFPEPTVFGPCNPFAVDSIDECPDLLIVTNPIFLSRAEELAAIHREKLGHSVAVVDQWNIFNRYSSGTPHVMAIRQFLRELATLSPGKLKGLILYGAATCRQSTWMTPESIYVLTPENEDPGFGSGSDAFGNYDRTKSFNSDTYFCRLSESDSTLAFASPFFRAMASPMEIMVGRIPVGSLADADAYNRKVLNWLEHKPLGGASAANALFISGFSRRTEPMHMADSEALVNMAMESSGGNLTAIRAHHNLFGRSATESRGVRNLVRQSLRRGVGLVSYFGHGSNDGCTGVWTSADVAATSFGAGFPVALLGACHGGQFDKYSAGFFSEMLFKPDGGAIALVVSGREVFQNYNVDFCGDFVRAFYSPSSPGFTGSAFMEAQNLGLKSAGKAALCNRFAYNFLGDPMLPLPRFIRSVSATGSFVPGGIVTLSGAVISPDGTVDTGFNGTVKATAFDCPAPATNKAPAVASGALDSVIDEVWVDQSPMGEIAGAVTNGRFEISGLLPDAPGGSGIGRVMLYAESSADIPVLAVGRCDSLVEAFPDSVAAFDSPFPEIFSAEVNESESGYLLKAVIYAPVGLGFGNFSVPVRVLVNGRALPSVAEHLRMVEPGMYELFAPLEVRSEGRVGVELWVTDLLRRQCSAAVEFMAVRNMECRLKADFIDGAVHFSVDSALSGSASIYIEDYSGRLVRLLRDSMFWDLLDSEGNAVPAGHYRAFVRVQTPVGTCHSRPIDIIIP